MPQFLNILLQKNDANLSWGFDISGGGRTGRSLTIHKVRQNSLSSQYLSENDRIVQIEGIDAELLSEAEALTFIKRPSKSLNLIVYKDSRNNRVDSNDNLSSTDYSNIESSSDSSVLKSSYEYPFRRRPAYKNYEELKDEFKNDTFSNKPRICKNSLAASADVFHAAPSRCCDRPTEHDDDIDLKKWKSKITSSTGRSISPVDRYAKRNTLVDYETWMHSTQSWQHSNDVNNSNTMVDDVVDTIWDNERIISLNEKYNSDIYFKKDSKIKSSSNTMAVKKLKTYKFGDHLRSEDFENVDGVSKDKEPKSKTKFTVRSMQNDDGGENISRVYLSPHNAKINVNDVKSFNYYNRTERQSNQTAEKNSNTQNPQESNNSHVPNNSERATSQAPLAPPAPPPPPPPILNGGNIPTIRLRSEIPDQPPAKIQSAMAKDKKPFTYTPGGIDLSEIKSPRMQRRIVRNAQEPEDRILPPTSTPINTNSLPPSAVAAMMPQMAIPVFPQNHVDLRNTHQKNNVNAPSPPPLPVSTRVNKTNAIQSPCQLEKNSNSSPTPQKQGSHSSSISQKPSMTNDTHNSTLSERPKTGSNVGSLYIPPVTNNDSNKSKQSSPPTFPTLREAPTPWLQKHQQPSHESVPFWANRNNQNGNNNDTKDVQQERRPFVIQVSKESESNKISNGNTHIVPIQIEGAAQTTSERNSRPNPQRWGNKKENNQTVEANVNNRTSKQNLETDSKPIQSRSFKVLQKITDSEDDSTDFDSNVSHNTEGIPLNQLKKLNLNDDKSFMNKVKTQVDDETFLHMETDPRYRGSAIPSRAFKMLQNMTDSGQVKSNNVLVIPIINKTLTNQTQNYSTSSTPEIHSQIINKSTDENETKKTYIPPSERQAEQELRKYMGSSIPSRSFKMLQAMTAAQDISENVIENTDTHNEGLEISCKMPFYPNPWSTPPCTAEDVFLLWQNYLYLYNLVFQQSSSSLVSRLPFFGEHLFENSNKVEITVTNNNKHSNLTLYNNYSNEKNLKIANASIKKPDTEKEKKIIVERILEDNCENDASVTVHLPLRKRSQTFDEEVTLKKPITVSATVRVHSGYAQNTLNENNENTSASVILKTTDENSSSKNQSSIQEIYDTNESSNFPTRYKFNSDILSTNVNYSDLDSDSDSSVDFWKEIVDNDDDLYFKNKRIEWNERNEANNQDQKCMEKNVLNENIHNLMDEAEENTKKFLNYTLINDGFHNDCSSYINESDITHNCNSNDDNENYSSSGTENNEKMGEKIKTKLITTEDDKHSLDSIEENKNSEKYNCYNVYEFSTPYEEHGRYSFDKESNKIDANNKINWNHCERKWKTEISKTSCEMPFTKPIDLEDEDSGMTSDISRCISETEIETNSGRSELRKINKYRKTTTHSTLYELLLTEEEKRRNVEKLDIKENEIAERKESLKLPLQTSLNTEESVSSSSGINSPLSPVVTDKLTHDLAKALLNWKKKDSLEKRSQQKLRETTKESLQFETSNNSRGNSPYFTNVTFTETKRNDGNCEVKNNDSLYYPKFDIIPSRAFKNLHLGRSTHTNWPKCPLLSEHN